MRQPGEGLDLAVALAKIGDLDRRQIERDAGHANHRDRQAGTASGQLFVPCSRSRCPAAGPRRTWTSWRTSVGCETCGVVLELAVPAHRGAARRCLTAGDRPDAGSMARDARALPRPDRVTMRACARRSWRPVAGWVPAGSSQPARATSASAGRRRAADHAVAGGARTSSRRPTSWSCRWWRRRRRPADAPPVRDGRALTWRSTGRSTPRGRTWRPWSTRTFPPRWR